MKPIDRIGAVGLALAASTVVLAEATAGKAPVYKVRDEVVVTGKVVSISTEPD